MEIIVFYELIKQSYVDSEYECSGDHSNKLERLIKTAKIGSDTDVAPVKCGRKFHQTTSKKTGNHKALQTIDA